MNISIKGLRISLTEAITEAVHTKLSALDKLIHTKAFVHVELGKPSSHHKSGDDVFMAEITIDMKGQTYFVQVANADMYQALDRAVYDIGEMIKQEKGKRQTLLRKGRMLVKQLIKKGFSD